jgi:hypothetical protein
MKTSELTGATLDWAVAKCEGYRLDLVPEGEYTPSTNWAQGGLIIELMGMNIIRTNKTDKEPWAACLTHYIDGATPLIAAMRCYVAYRMGDEVDVPEELKNE